MLARNGTSRTCPAFQTAFQDSMIQNRTAIWACLDDLRVSSIKGVGLAWKFYIRGEEARTASPMRRCHVALANHYASQQAPLAFDEINTSTRSAEAPAPIAIKGMCAAITGSQRGEQGAIEPTLLRMVMFGWFRKP